jgi:hypothetical protein
MAKIWFARRGPELWNKLEEMPAQSITGVAIKLAAMMHYAARSLERQGSWG